MEILETYQIRQPDTKKILLEMLKLQGYLYLNDVHIIVIEPLLVECLWSNIYIVIKEYI